MLKNLFRKEKYLTVSTKTLEDKKYLPNIPDDEWMSCTNCKMIIYKDDLQKNYNICPKCNHHFNMSAMDRIDSIFDKNSFKELFTNITYANPLDFEGYEEKLKDNRKKSNLDEAVVTGVGKIEKKLVASAIMDSKFMMGSMGCVVGEKITKLVEYATENKLPLIIFTASGGARMQEGIFSLMQMAKTSAAIGRHSHAGLLYISVITNPTTGGVSASFAMQGDIIIGEPNATIGFAGRRVIENTIKEKLPKDFQSAEFALKKGFMDLIVNRKELRDYLDRVLTLHGVVEYVK